MSGKTPEQIMSEYQDMPCSHPSFFASEWIEYTIGEHVTKVTKVRCSACLEEKSLIKEGEIC